MLEERQFVRWTNFALLSMIGGSIMAGMFLVVQTIEAEREQRKQSSQTAQVVAELRNVSRAALNAETGQRGYLITLDRRYLEPYEAGRAEFQPALDRLRMWLGEDATAQQLQLLDRIESLTQAKFAEMGESVALLRGGELLDARRRILSDEGQEVMVRLRQAIGEMERIENDLLNQSAEETVKAEARVLPLLTGVIILLLVALLFGYRLVSRTAQAEARAEQSAALAQARDRADLLARELNHRVKNLFAVILAIVSMSARDEPAAKPLVDRISNRIRALLTAHEVTQGTADQPAASLANLIEITLAPYRSDRMPAKISGPETLLPAQHVTPLGLVLHELTTNAVKYGAWANGGLLTVNWQITNGQLILNWTEACEIAEIEPASEGFGSMLMVSAARQLGGTIERSFAPHGVHVGIVIPLEV